MEVTSLDNGKKEESWFQVELLADLNRGTAHDSERIGVEPRNKEALFKRVARMVRMSGNFAGLTRIRVVGVFIMEGLLELSTNTLTRLLYATRFGL